MFLGKRNRETFEERIKFSHVSSTMFPSIVPAFRFRDASRAGERREGLVQFANLLFLEPFLPSRGPRFYTFTSMFFV
jgi:hypothetical protein